MRAAMKDESKWYAGNMAYCAEFGEVVSVLRAGDTCGEAALERHLANNSGDAGKAVRCGDRTFSCAARAAAVAERTLCALPADAPRS